MMRPLVLLTTAALCLSGCYCDDLPSRRFVPASTVVPVTPQPATLREFRSAEQQGYLVAATGSGPAFGWFDEPLRLTNGEPLHVLRVNTRTGEILARRLDYGSIARLSLEGVEVRDTTYHH